MTALMLMVIIQCQRYKEISHRLNSYALLFATILVAHNGYMWYAFIIEEIKIV